VIHEQNGINSTTRQALLWFYFYHDQSTKFWVFSLMGGHAFLGASKRDSIPHATRGQLELIRDFPEF
jgi:hypothetical protein